MTVIQFIETSVRVILKSLNVIVGVIVGSIFGALVSILLIAFIGSGFSFSGNWLWSLTPGMVLGAYAGIKAWPLMLGLCLGGDGDVGGCDSDVEIGNSEAPDLEQDTAGPESESADEKEDNETGAW